MALVPPSLPESAPEPEQERRQGATPTPSIHDPLDASVLEAALEANTATRQTTHDITKARAMATPMEPAAAGAAADEHERPGSGPMPLWRDADRPDGTRVRTRPAPHGAAADEDVWAAWDEICTGVPAAEVRAAVSADVAVLNRTVHAPITDEPEAATEARAAWAPVEPASAVPKVTEAAAAVDTATTGADSHATSLESYPEWQRIQTVRGALRHVWEVMKEKAGPAWDSLRADVRFQGFWKTMSIRACEAISVQAAALANRLRRGTGDLPAADALLKLSDTTLTYSTVAEAQPVTAHAPTREPDAAGGSMQRLVEPKIPAAYATREDAARAAAEITAHFQTWITSPMGQELAASDHGRVTAFRDAWQQLPPHDAGPGPAVGPYGAVAERAQALVTTAVTQGRFAPGDLQALQALAQAADHHAARLAVTLPPGMPRPVPRAAAAAPAAAAPAPPQARTPRLSA
ncbi:hypothetical protein AB0B01_17275 [Streptomyces sp. NPDC044571]|uniref:hypothetical protein n=1 Tax=Streptomyces sp. NPDC044571 TaxID=3155371 RepID=UPI0033E67161